MAIKFFNDLTIPGVITDSTLTLGDAFIKWDSANTILRIDGTGTYDGIYIGDPDGDAIIFEGTDIALSSSTGDAGAYAINNATGGSLALQLKAGTVFNSTIEVPEASGTIALTTDLDGSGGTLSNYLPLAGGTMTGNLLIDDGGIGGPYIGLGDDADLKIFHNGSHSIIRETGTGNLYLQSDQNVILSKDSGTEFMIKGIADGAVELYYDNVKKFETSTDGVVLSGDLITNGNRITHAGSGTVSFLDFTKTLFSETNHTVLSSVKSIDFFLDSNLGDSGQAFRIYNNQNPDGSVTENTYIFKVDESGDVLIKGNYTINNATGGSMNLQLKAGTVFNSTIEVPEASGTIALTTDLDGSGGTLSNYLPLAGGTMTGLANIDMDGGQITNVSYLYGPSGTTDGWDNIRGSSIVAETTFNAPGFTIDASENATFDGGGAGGVFNIEQTDFQFTGPGGGVVIEINTPVGAADTTDIKFRTDGGVYSNTGTLSYDGPNTTGDRTWTFPDASGILALTSDITANGIYDGSGNLSTDTVISMSDISSPSTEFKLRFDNTLAETVLSIDPTINSVGIGTSTPAANLNVIGNTADSVVFKVDGTVGELFTITDSLTGVLFSVNNISGLPIFEVEDTDEIRMGNYLAPSGYTTGRGQVTSTGDTIIHTVDISSYTMVIFEYTVSDGTNSRAATITAVTDGASVQSTETGITPDIGTTADITMSVTLDASPAELNLVATTASTTGWNVKTIVRTI